MSDDSWGSWGWGGFVLSIVGLAVGAYRLVPSIYNYYSTMFVLSTGALLCLYWFMKSWILSLLVMMLFAFLGLQYFGPEKDPVLVRKIMEFVWSWMSKVLLGENAKHIFTIVYYAVQIISPIFVASVCYMYYFDMYSLVITNDKPDPELNKDRRALNAQLFYFSFMLAVNVAILFDFISAWMQIGSFLELIGVADTVLMTQSCDVNMSSNSWIDIFFKIMMHLILLLTYLSFADAVLILEDAKKELNDRKGQTLTKRLIEKSSDAKKSPTKTRSDGKRIELPKQLSNNSQFSLDRIIRALRHISRDPFLNNSAYDRHHNSQSNKNIVGYTKYDSAKAIGSSEDLFHDPLLGSSSSSSSSSPSSFFSSSSYIPSSHHKIPSHINVDSREYEDLYGHVREILLEDAKLYIERLDILADDVITLLRAKQWIKPIVPPLVTSAEGKFYKANDSTINYESREKDGKDGKKSWWSQRTSEEEDFVKLKKSVGYALELTFSQTTGTKPEKVHDIKELVRRLSEKLDNDASSSADNSDESRTIHNYKHHLEYFSMISRQCNYEDDCATLRELSKQAEKKQREYQQRSSRYGSNIDSRLRKEEDILLQMFLFRATRMCPQYLICDHNFERESRPGYINMRAEDDEESQGFNDIVIVKLNSNTNSEHKYALKWSGESAYHLSLEDREGNPYRINRDKGIIARMVDKISVPDHMDKQKHHTVHMKKFAHVEEALFWFLIAIFNQNILDRRKAGLPQEYVRFEPLITHFMRNANFENMNQKSLQERMLTFLQKTFPEGSSTRRK